MSSKSDIKASSSVVCIDLFIFSRFPGNEVCISTADLFCHDARQERDKAGKKQPNRHWKKFAICRPEQVLTYSSRRL